MSAVHLITTVQAASELWHVRLYSVPDYWSQYAINPNTIGNMRTHLDLLTQSQAATPVEFDPILVSAIGDRTMAIDGEMLQGSPTYQNLKLSLKADAAFAPLVAAMRDLRTEVWIEIVVEQAVQDCPKLKPGAFYWPRKSRQIFWGKADKKESSGEVAREKATITNSSYLADSSKNAAHAGTMEFTFVHWLKVRGAVSTRDWLDGVKASKLFPPGFLSSGGPGSGAPGSIGYIMLATGSPPPAWQFIPVSLLFYTLVGRLSPTELFGMCDERLLAPDTTAPQSGNGGMQIRSALYNGNVNTKDLFEVWVPIRTTAFYFTSGGNDFYSVFDSPLFEAPASDGSVGSMSLYNLKDLAEAIVRLSDEFFFKFGFELPTLDEAYEVRKIPANDLTPSNIPGLRMAFWKTCSRWLFQSVDHPTAELFLDPNEQTIKYNEAAQFCTSVKVSLPTPKDTGPESVTESYSADPDIQAEFDMKLLFRFTAMYRPTLNTLAWHPSGVELYLGPDEMHLGEIRMGTGEVGVIAEEGWLKGRNLSWEDYHGYLHLLRWGNCRASVEFDSHGRGVEPFGASNRDAVKPRRDYKLNDIGDFPLLRHFTMRTGMLPKLDYAINEITLAPKKPLHIKALELNPIDKKSGPLQTTTIIEPPLVPPPPHLITTDPANGSSIAIGTLVTIAANADQPGDATSSIKVFINNDFLDYADANAVNHYSFTWDTTGLAAGAYTITLICYDIQGQFGQATISVTLR